jgi:glycosyltransferase involved in cell wall biosynthesis
MRVGLGIFSRASPALEIGPIDTALGLAARGVDVTIFAEPGMELPRRAGHLADRVVELPPPRVTLSRRLGAAVFLAHRLELGRRWAQALRAHPVDVVHAFSPGATALLPRDVAVVVQAFYHPARSTFRRRLNRESAYGTGGFGAGLPGPVREPVRLAAHVAYQGQTSASDALGYRRADLLLTATPSATTYFAERGRPAVCVPPCVEVAAAPAPRAAGDAFRIAFCAHPLDRPWKGLSYLLEALPAVPAGRPLEVTLFGGWDSPDPPPGGVEITGRLARDDYLERVAEMDALVAPALWEEWGYSLFEALSRGVPVIAFDLYPYTETIDDELGVLVPPRDTAALARAIAAARDGALPARERVLNAARERFGPDATAARLVGAYERTLAQAARTSAA